MNSALEDKLITAFTQDKRRGTISDSQLLALLYHEWDITPSEATRRLDCFDSLNTIETSTTPTPTAAIINTIQACRTRTHHNYHQW